MGKFLISAGVLLVIAGLLVEFGENGSMQNLVGFWISHIRRTA